METTMKAFIKECEDTLHWTLETKDFTTDATMNKKATIIAAKYSLIIDCVRMATISSKCIMYPYMYCAYYSVKMMNVPFPTLEQNDYS
jgi:hypothetical protein